MARTRITLAVSIMPEDKQWMDAISAETGMNRSEIVRWMRATIVQLNIKPIIIRTVGPSTAMPPTNDRAAD